MEGLHIEGKWDPKELEKVFRAMDRVGRSVKFYIDSGEGMRMMSIKYLELLRFNIAHQTFATSYPKYHKKYRDWKLNVGKPLKFWILFGDFLYNLQSFKVGGKDWMGGIPAGLMDKGGKSWFGFGDKGKPKPIAMYGSVEEERRPLFEPTFRQFTYGKTVAEVGDAWKVADEILIKIGDNWR